MRAASTQLVGVVGWPIAHSRSPAMQNAALKSLGLDWVYLPFAVPPEKLPAAIRGAQALGVRGLNVTIPHKEAALQLCEPDPMARDVGAVNTLVFDGDRIVGYNTDVHGFRMLLAEAGVQAMRPMRTLVLGAGGAARGVVIALRTAGFHDVRLMSRRGEPLVIKDELMPVMRWDDEMLSRELESTDLLVDATPRGLDDREPPIDLSSLPPSATVLDLAVKRDTTLTLSAKARGLAAFTGTAMLLHQGAAALERWVGQPAPLETMRAALEASLD